MRRDEPSVVSLIHPVEQLRKGLIHSVTRRTLLLDVSLLLPLVS